MVLIRFQGKGDNNFAERLQTLAKITSHNQKMIDPLITTVHFLIFNQNPSIIRLKIGHTCPQKRKLPMPIYTYTVVSCSQPSFLAHENLVSVRERKGGMGPFLTLWKMSSSMEAMALQICKHQYENNLSLDIPYILTEYMINFHNVSINVSG